MKLCLTLIFSLLVSSTTGQSIDGNIKYGSPLMITRDNASSIDSFENTPESIVRYFYASKIRGDNDWEKVVLAEKDRSETFVNELSIYESWTILKFRLVSREEYIINRLWITVFVEIEYDGKTDSGNDEVYVDLINGKWTITRVPI